jgi:hypothetical protein
MTSMVLLGDSTLEYLTPSVNAPLDLYLHIAFVRWKLQFLPSHGATQGENELLIKAHVMRWSVLIIICTQVAIFLG